jgi:arylsulfatase A-like enzyme
MKLNDIVVPPYLVDDQATRQDLLYYYEEVKRFDLFIGKTVAALKQEGILDNTLIFVLADNGRPFPRAKTRLHDSGMKTGLVAHWPKGIKNPGKRISNLVSVIDLAPTIFDAAGVHTKVSFQGVSIGPIFENDKAKTRDYVFSEHNWHDHEALGRSVRYGDFLYIENHRPKLPWQGPNDAVSSPSFKSILSGVKAGTLTPAQADVLMAPRSEVELYMNSKDDLQLINLAGKPEYRKIEKSLKKVLAKWAKETGDTYPENIKPDRFDRMKGGVIPGFDDREVTWSYSGASTEAHRIHHKGPILK